MVNLPVQWGAFIAQVGENSPADIAGLQRRDIITSSGGITLDEDHSYINVLFSHAAGEKVEIEVLRGTQTLTLELTLGGIPE